MMILKTVYLVSAIAFFIMTFCMSRMCAKELLGDGSEFKFKKSTSVEKFIAFVRLFIVAFCPIINFCFVMIMVFAWEQVYESCLDRMEERLEWK